MPLQQSEPDRPAHFLLNLRLCRDGRCDLSVRLDRNAALLHLQNRNGWSARKLQGRCGARSGSKQLPDLQARHGARNLSCRHDGDAAEL